MYPRIIGVGHKLKEVFSNLKSSEVAEALLATWCVEYLRVRRLGGFNVVEITAISLLMLSVKAIITEASRRRYNDKSRTFVMSSRTTPVGEVVSYRNATYSHSKYGRDGERRSHFRQSGPRYQHPYEDL